MHTDTIVLELGTGEHDKGKIRIRGYPEDVQLACGRLAQFVWGTDEGDGRNWSQVEAEVADLATAQAAICSILPAPSMPTGTSGAIESSGWVEQTLMFSLPLSPPL